MNGDDFNPLLLGTSQCSPLSPPELTENQNLVGLVRQGTFTLDQKLYIYWDVFLLVYASICTLVIICSFYMTFSMTQRLLHVYCTWYADQESHRFSSWIIWTWVVRGHFILSQIILF